jgi:hypothetical protein
MISEKQLAANRRNAQRSPDPRTEEGKKTSPLNARRHNLTGQVTAMTDADRIIHEAFSASIVESLAPEGAMETQLAQRIATDSWRGECKSNGQDLSPRCAGKEGISGQRLLALQAACLAKREAEMKEAKKLLQLSEMKGLPYGPAEIKRDGFVFSNAEIHAAIDKERRLSRADQCDFTQYKPKNLLASAA